MRLVLGIDPGAKGGLALYDRDAEKLFQVWDMPIFYQIIGRSKRPRVNVPELSGLLQTCKELGADLAVLESVGGMPKQSAPNAFTFGWSCGVVYMGLVSHRFTIDPIKAAFWKAKMRCGSTDEEILARAAELFPNDTHRWFNKPRGKVAPAFKDGRAEAAMLALFGAKYCFGQTQPGAEERMLTL